MEKQTHTNSEIPMIDNTKPRKRREVSLLTKQWCIRAYLSSCVESLTSKRTTTYCVVNGQINQIKSNHLDETASVVKMCLMGRQGWLM